MTRARTLSKIGSDPAIFPGNVNITGVATATTFSGAVTGNVTGNASGSSGSCTGNAAGLTGTPNITVGAINASGISTVGVLTAYSAISADAGIDFSGAQTNQGGMTSELLDHYEEGTWTPTLYGTTGSAGSEAYLYAVGQYTKIGRLVHARFQLVKTNLGSWTGDLRIGGMPFAALATTAGSLSLYPSANVDAVMRGIQMNGAQSYASITSGAKLDVVAPYSEIVTGYYLQAAITYNV